MINKPLVCICIPNYNNEKTISETLDSLLNQTYKNIVIKIFDNASTDNGMIILKSYQAKYDNIHVFQNEANIGGEANFTRCIENMGGEFGAIFHADDLYDSTMVEIQVNYLLANDISAVFVRAKLINEHSKNIGEQFFPSELTKEKYYEFDFENLFPLILKYDNFLITPSVMARVDIYQNQIKAWSGEKFKTSSDLDVWLKFSEIKKVGLITDKLISYRMSPASYSYRIKYNRFERRDMFLVIDYYLENYKNKSFNLPDYEFLKFKDQLLIVNNLILNDKTVDTKMIQLLNTSVLQKVFLDKQKFKIYCFAIIIKLLIYLNLKQAASRLIKFIYKIPY